jgi:integrase
MICATSHHLFNALYEVDTMTRKRKQVYGAGSIYQRTDGRYVGSLMMENGKRKSFYGKDEREVQGKLDQARYEKKQGIITSGPQQTMKRYLDYWLDEVHREHIRESTYRMYRSHMKNHLFPCLGHIKLHKLTVQHVQSFYNQRRRDENLAPGTIRYIHAILHHALDHAVKVGLIPRNVCDLVSLPPKEEQEIHPLNFEQAQKLLEAARGHKLECLLIVALTTGMRKGEMLGLKWKDIDLEDKRVLSVQRTVIRMKGEFREGKPKTLKSKRNIVLPHFVIEALKKHMMQQMDAKLQSGSAWKENDLVFCSPDGGHMFSSTINKSFHKLLEAAGLPRMRFHDLRHSAATILLSMGVQTKVIQDLLGHSSYSVTMDIYSHVLPSMREEVPNRWDKAFSKDFANTDKENR